MIPTDEDSYALPSHLRATSVPSEPLGLTEPFRIPEPNLREQSVRGMRKWQAVSCSGP